MTFKHQGDINFVTTTSVLGNKINHKGSFTLALGEKTGHKHVITVANPDSMEIYQDGATYFITLKTEAKVTHNQHGTITLAPGIYRMGHEREHDYFAEVTRQVID